MREQSGSDCAIAPQEGSWWVKPIRMLARALPNKCHASQPLKESGPKPTSSLCRFGCTRGIAIIGRATRTRRAYYHRLIRKFSHVGVIDVSPVE